MFHTERHSRNTITIIIIIVVVVVAVVVIKKEETSKTNWEVITNN